MNINNMLGNESVAPTMLADAAIHHAEDSDPDHLVGDLQQIISTAWAVMSPDQRKAFLLSPDIISVFECGREEDRLPLMDYEPA